MLPSLPSSGVTDLLCRHFQTLGTERDCPYRGLQRQHAPMVLKGGEPVVNMLGSQHSLRGAVWTMWLPCSITRSNWYRATWEEPLPGVMSQPPKCTVGRQVLPPHSVCVCGGDKTLYRNQQRFSCLSFCSLPFSGRDCFIIEAMPSVKLTTYKF